MNSDIDWARIARDLAAPFPAGDLKTKPGKGGGQLTYIDARTVAERLDQVVGPENWAFTWEPMIVSDDAVHVVKGTLTIHGVSKSDIGDSEKIEPNKGAVSDALKRAAVLWGVGRYLYGIESPQAARAAAQTPRPQSPPGPRVVAQERRALNEAATDTPDPAYEAAVQAFKHNATLAGYETPEAQSAYVREQFPNRRIKSLTTDEWTELAGRLRSMYAPDESEEI